MSEEPHKLFAQMSIWRMSHSAGEFRERVWGCTEVDRQSVCAFLGVWGRTREWGKGQVFILTQQHNCVNTIYSRRFVCLFSVFVLCYLKQHFMALKQMLYLMPEDIMKMIIGVVNLEHIRKTS